MKKRRDYSAPTHPWPSEDLRTAALAGLLCLATVACSPEADTRQGDAHITSSESVGELTEAQFTALCDERGGTVEVMPHCGGFATAKGFSYDNATLLLSEHTCAGANTCGGWNCAIVD